jgi:cysteine desulfurase
MIYFDNNATTPLDPKIVPLLSQALLWDPYNPSSVHTYGQKGKRILNQARESIASYLKVKPSEIIFTSGGTESMNLVINGVVSAGNFDTILTTRIEHACVYESCIELKKNGYPIHFLEVNTSGTIQVDQLKEFPRGKKTCLILSSVNSETGVLLPLEEIKAFARNENITLILDGVAHLGKSSLSIDKSITAIGFSGHKIHAPKGIGFFYLKEGTPFKKSSFGGPQEFSKRPGTENLFAIYGLKLSIEQYIEKEAEITANLIHLRTTFEDSLLSLLSGCSINGEGVRVPNTVNIHFDGVDGETMLIHLDQKGLCASMGSACSSGALEPSRVLIEMGYSKLRAKESLRFSFSKFNTLDEVEKAVKIIAQSYQELKNIFV